MRRREFFTALFGGAVAAATGSPPLYAQQEPIRPLIGFLSPLSATAARRNVASFRSAMRDLGHIDGRSMTLQLRYADGAPERIEPLARELVALNPDVLVAGAKSGALAVHNATRTIPIVTNTPEDPVVLGLAKSIAKPGGNVTGTWTIGGDALVGKRLNFLKLAMPGITRVGIVINPDDSTDSVTLPRLPAAADALGLTITIIEVRDPRNLDDIAAAIENAGVQALFVGQGPTFNSVRPQIAAIVARLKLPAVYGFREFAEAGGLMSYGPNLPDIYRQTARLVDKILKGAKPGDLPFELPTRYELILNLKTARAMGLTLPNAFVLLADELIE